MPARSVDWFVVERFRNMTQVVETMRRMIRSVVLIAFIMSSMLVFGCSGGGDDQENLPPSADAGPEQAVDELTLVTLSGSGTDSDGTIVSYAWSQVGVPAVTINDTDTAHATFTAPEVTEETLCTFRLTVTDNEGANDSDDVTITVNPVKVPPSADASLDRFVTGETGVTLSGSGTDSDGTIVSYAWSQVGGGRGNNKQCRRRHCQLYVTRGDGSIDLSADRDRQ